MTTKAIAAVAATVQVLANKAFGMVPLGLIHWFPQTNDSRVETKAIQQAGKNAEQGVFESIRENGWKQDEPVYVMPFDALVFAINGIKYTADMALNARLEQMAEWRKNDETLPLYDTMRAVWFHDGDLDKPIRPIYMGIDGNRRAAALPEILTTWDNPESFVVPVVCRVFESNQERIIAQLAANTSRQMSGVKNLGWPDYLKAGVRILDNGGNENALRQAFGKVGTAQKVFGIVKVSHLTAEYAKANGFKTLLERCSLDNPKKDERVYAPGSWVPAESLDKEKLRGILKEHANSKEAAGVALESYVKEMFAGKANAPKVTGKDVWENVTADVGSPFDVIRKLHTSGQSFGPLKESYPELFSARYSGFIAEPTDVQPVGTVAEQPAEVVENVKATAAKSAHSKGRTMAGAKGRKG